MADEREDRYDGQDEGEYHFSDDDMNYDMADTDTVSASTQTETKTAALSSGASLPSLLARYRRVLIALLAFGTLVFVVYKFLAPSSAPPAAEFSKSQSAPTVAVSAPIPSTPAPTVASAAPPAATTPPPAVTTTASAVAPVASPAAASNETNTSPVVTVVAAPPPAQDAASVMERLAFLEQQNAKMMNMMQSDYGQKMAEIETERQVMLGKIQNLSKRLAAIEGSLNQLAQSMDGAPAPAANANHRSMSAPMAASLPPTRSVESKAAYTVQAIIPGRAWLKSDGGDTVTVAEGDVLRGYGRIAKIDPYDGTVEIDTGSKTLILSYGVSAG